MARTLSKGAAVRQEATEATIAAIGQKAMYSGGTVAFFGGVSANSIAAIGGLVVGVIGLIVTVYYKRRDNERKEELHRLRVNSRILHPYEDQDDE